MGRPSDPRERFPELATLVGAPQDFSLDQWRRLYDRALASRADLLLEVGRLKGNSTVVLTEAAHTLRARCVSVSNDEPPVFELRTWPRLRPVVGRRWRKRLEVITGDVCDYTPPACKRAFVFWDAHGTEVADAMLGRIIPALPADSAIVVHDVSAERESPEASPLIYRFRWRGLISRFPELPMIGVWLDEHGIRPEHDTHMLAFTL